MRFILGLALISSACVSERDYASMDRFEKRYHAVNGSLNFPIVTLRDLRTGACFVAWNNGLAEAPKSVCE